MYGREKVKKAYGKFVSEKDMPTLKKAQKLRLIFTHCASLTFAITLFLPLEWAEKSRDIIWLHTVYIFFVIALIVLSVMAAFTAGKSCNLTKEISEKYKPKAGFEKATFAYTEWFVYAHVIHALIQLGLVIYGFGVWGVVAVLLTSGGAVFAILARVVTFRALKEDLKYIPPQENGETDKAEESSERKAEEK